jgi:hypothetical protein
VYAGAFGEKLSNTGVVVTGASNVAPAISERHLNSMMTPAGVKVWWPKAVYVQFCSTVPRGIREQLRRMQQIVPFC